MNLYSYVVRYDFGFAPNPFHGWCTLATCKPKIRAGAERGDWIIGVGSQDYKLGGRLVYAMQVAEVLTFDAYWNDVRFLCKRPVLNGSLKQVYGDNIYHKVRGQWIQEDSHHSLERGMPNQKNMDRDTSVDRLLISNRFVYFGEAAPAIPSEFRPFRKTGKTIYHQGRSHLRLSSEVALAVEAWLVEQNVWGVQGLPSEFARHVARKRRENRGRLR